VRLHGIKAIGVKIKGTKWEKAMISLVYLFAGVNLSQTKL